jgi:vancomycin resistance protein YoaR
VIVPGVNGLRCCGPDTPRRIVDALEDGERTVAVALREVEPKRTSDDLRKLAIVEQVGTFTTKHAANQPRVTNIHRIADLVDGTIIGPGGRFSVNDKVGERTTERGFVVDHSIQDGVFVDAVGGGISQFATTLFNAAFFAGLELPTYQSHSIYISRYPYGREATLSWPKPDLVVANPSPYGVLIDTSYTSTSVTITLYSTRWATGEQTAQSASPVGQCTRVKTERTRHFVDGTTKVDNVFATYRPAEGVHC